MRRPAGGTLHGLSGCWVMVWIKVRRASTRCETATYATTSVVGLGLTFRAFISASDLYPSETRKSYMCECVCVTRVIVVVVVVFPVVVSPLYIYLSCRRGVFDADTVRCLPTPHSNTMISLSTPKSARLCLTRTHTNKRARIYTLTHSFSIRVLVSVCFAHTQVLGSIFVHLRDDNALATVTNRNIQTTTEKNTNNNNKKIHEKPFLVQRSRRISTRSFQFPSRVELKVFHIYKYIYI